jgi:LmbE family N-acetylglucosaminyl deacetylase
VAGLGTVLMTWAHPDDETFLAGGLSAALTDAGHRVVCVTATRGDAGMVSTDGSHARLLDRREVAVVRTRELEAALEVLGVGEHHWLDYPDGGCAEVDPDEAAARLAEIVDDVRPDTVMTFGPDGITGHPDHRAMSAWVDLALARTTEGPRLLHAVGREVVLDEELDEDFGVYELGRPRVVPDDELDLLLALDGDALDRKVEALLRQESQTGRLVAAVGLERFRAWVAYEAYAEPT